jgi:hypothetical protein
MLKYTEAINLDSMYDNRLSCGRVKIRKTLFLVVRWSKEMKHFNTNTIKNKYI